ncbi:MAG: ribose 5-phosphate isomerase B [Tissierellia bacterium]|nr:ribose 5-phosphate isomerase B [Tissierellia bacterium]
MKIGFGSDHGGIDLKLQLMEALAEEGYSCFDYGSFEGERVDYPDYAKKIGLALRAKDIDLGLLFCGTGIGISIAANKIPGVYCANVSEEFSARMAKEHNNANCLALGGRTLGRELALSIVRTFLEAEFQGDRHKKRLDKIKKMEDTTWEK